MADRPCSVLEAVNKAKNRLNVSYDLHPEQQKVISLIVSEKKDCICVLPTGFGKSIIYQLLPFVNDELNGTNTTCVIVVSPLNAIIEDQIYKLSPEYHASVIKRHSAAMHDLQKSKLIFGHAESFVEDTTIRNLLREPDMQTRVKAIVVDEAHFVVQWKQFRPAYSKLSALGSLFPDVPILALTATANAEYRREIQDSLAMRNPEVVERNPDRPNLFLSVQRRPHTGEHKVHAPLESLVNELRDKKDKMPRTLVYGSLEVCGECFEVFSSELGPEQYFPSNAPSTFENRLFAQYHAQYPTKYKDALVQALVKGTCTARVIFVTVAFGVGIDVKDVERVIHIGVPCTMEEFYQEIGRAGRDGRNATSTAYYNSHDISKARRALTPIMREYVTTTSCRRVVILRHFQAVPLSSENVPSHKCCDNCAMCCSCNDCICNRELDSVIASVPDDYCDSDTQSTCKTSKRDDVCLPNNEQLRSDLLELRMSLSPSVTSLGISLTTGFSLALIDQVLEKFHLLNSLTDVEAELPIFSASHASQIWEVIKRYKME